MEELCVYIVQGTLVQSCGVQGTPETLSYSMVVGSIVQEGTRHRSGSVSWEAGSAFLMVKPMT